MQQSPFRDDTLRGKASLNAGLRSPRHIAAQFPAEQSCALQVAFITGGGSGIGYEIARQLGKAHF